MNRLHPLSAVRTAINYGVAGMAIPIVLGLLLGGIFDWVQTEWGFTLAPVGFAIGSAYGVAYYYRYEFGFTDDTFDLSSGVYARRSREIPYHRIQNVDLRQGVVHRLLGLAVVSIETAGGGSTEAVLDFVSEDVANELQREIRRRTAMAKTARERGKTRRDRPTMVDDRREDREGRIVDRDGIEVDGDPKEDSRGVIDHKREGVTDRSLGPEPTPPSDTDTDTDTVPATVPERESERDTYMEPPLRDERPKLLFDLQSRELLLYSFTSFRPAAIAAILFAVFFFTDQIVAYLLAVADPVGGPADFETATPGNYLVLAIVSLINGVAVTYGVSVAYTFATYYGFRLGRSGEDFVYERGLVQRYSGSIPAEKVQSVTVTENPLQRAIGYAGLWVETAGYGPDTGGGSQSAVPLAQTARVHGFTERLTGVETPRFTRPTTIARRRYLVRYTIVASVIVAIAYGFTLAFPFERWYIAATAFVAVPPAAHLRYVNLGYYVGTDHLVIRRGFWKRRTTVVPYYRVQTITTKRSIFQRRLGIASVLVDTASSRTFSGPTPTIYDESLEPARETHRTSRKRLQSALRKRAGESADAPGISVDFT